MGNRRLWISVWIDLNYFYRNAKLRNASIFRFFFFFENVRIDI